MVYCKENCLEMPESFPADEYTQFRQAAREVLTNPAKGDAWREFAGASNLIGWRFRAMHPGSLQ